MSKKIIVLREVPNPDGTLARLGKPHQLEPKHFDVVLDRFESAELFSIVEDNHGRAVIFFSVDRDDYAAALKKEAAAAEAKRQAEAKAKAEALAAETAQALEALAAQEVEAKARQKEAHEALAALETPAKRKAA